MDRPTLYVVSNGRQVLHLEPAPEGGYVVTSPFDPALITEAETIEEAFENAEDAAQTLAAGRAKLTSSASRPTRSRRKPPAKA
jgi:predicted RNase H-like HicB family nuclease